MKNLFRMHIHPNVWLGLSRGSKRPSLSPSNLICRRLKGTAVNLTHHFTNRGSNSTVTLESKL